MEPNEITLEKLKELSENYTDAELGYLLFNKRRAFKYSREKLKELLYHEITIEKIGLIEHGHRSYSEIAIVHQCLNKLCCNADLDLPTIESFLAITAAKNRAKFKEFTCHLDTKKHTDKKCATLQSLFVEHEPNCIGKCISQKLPCMFTASGLMRVSKQVGMKRQYILRLLQGVPFIGKNNEFDIIIERYCKLIEACNISLNDINSLVDDAKCLCDHNILTELHNKVQQHPEANLTEIKQSLFDLLQQKLKELETGMEKISEKLVLHDATISNVYEKNNETKRLIKEAKRQITVKSNALTESLTNINQIKQLELGNKQLKQDDEQLELRIKQLKQDVEQLELGNKQLKKDVDQLKLGNKELRQEVEQLKRDNEATAQQGKNFMRLLVIIVMITIACYFYLQASYN